MERIAVALALALLAPLADAQSLGRFFFTPAERTELDTARVQRKHRPAPPAPPRVSEALPAPMPLPQTITYGGIVRRSDGRSLLWLNDRLADEKEALAGLNLRGRVGADGSVSLEVPDGADIRVKVGQSVEVRTGRVAEKPRSKAERGKSNDIRNTGADE